MNDLKGRCLPGLPSLKRKKKNYNNVLQRGPSAEYSAVNCTLEQSQSMSIH